MCGFCGLEGHKCEHPPSVTVSHLWSVHTSSRATSTGLWWLHTSVYVLSLPVICLSQSLLASPFPSPHIHVPKNDRSSCPSFSSLSCLYLDLSSLPLTSLSLCLPFTRTTKAALCRCVHLADRHSVAQWEAILPQCEAIVVCNIMDREVKQRYWFSCWRGELCEARFSPYTRVSRGSCSPSLGQM